MFDYDRCTVEHNGVAYIDGERIKTGTKFYTPILTPAMEILKNTIINLQSLLYSHLTEALKS